MGKGPRATAPAAAAPSGAGMAGHTHNSPFFRRPAKDWSISEYLAYARHPDGRSPRRILDGWKKSLDDITRCGAPHCCSDAHRLRARALLARYDEQGNGSDRYYGQVWLKGKTLARDPAPSAPPPAQTIVHGALYQGPVEKSLFNLNNQPGEITNNHTEYHAAGDDSLATAGAASPASRKRNAPEKPNGGERAMRPKTAPPSGLAPPPAFADADLESELQLDPTFDGIVEADKIASVIKAAFAKTYDSMVESHKWKLASGRTVEGVISAECRNMDDETFATSLAQSFVVDVTCPTMESWFTVDEWAEIKESVPALPKPDPEFVQSLRRFFSVKTAADLRRVLQTTSYLPDGVEYERAKHFDSEWADLVMRMLLVLFEAPGEPLRAAHLEDWYTSYLWSPIFDQCLLSLPGMTIERKESPCRATALRKNRHRTQTGGPRNRLKSGRRLDAVIRTVEDDTHEYGGMEVARTSSGGATSTKQLGDAWKLARSLRDMLHRLHEAVEHDEAVVGALQVVGVFSAGLASQLVRMSHPRGYVCLLMREMRHTVPTGAGELWMLLRLLAHVTQMKRAIADCAERVRRRLEGRSEDELLRELLDGPAEKRERLFWAADTP